METLRQKESPVTKARAGGGPGGQGRGGGRGAGARPQAVLSGPRGPPGMGGDRQHTQPVRRRLLLEKT